MLRDGGIDDHFICSDKIAPFKKKTLRYFKSYCEY